MAAVGRILQAIGWVWIALGFFGSFINLPFDLNLFPGIIIVFFARILRAQAARSEPVEPGDSAPEERGVEPRPLNTDRPRPPVTREEPIASVETQIPAQARVPEPQPTPEDERDEMLEQILLAGAELAEESTSPESVADDGTSEGTTGPISSAEMIAQARKRWNKRP